MEEKVSYSFCKKCKGDNYIEKITCYDKGEIQECETFCYNCGHKDYWMYTAYESDIIEMLENEHLH